MRSLALVVLSLVFVSCASQPTRSIASSADRQPTQLTGWNFDWDDNIAYMKTDVILYRKKNAPKPKFMHQGIVVSTEEFTEVRHQMGAGQAYADYEVVNDDRVGSFRYFRDSPGRNNFAEEVKEIVEGTGRAQGASPGAWHGPSWESFTEALSDPTSSEWTSIITARGHSKDAVYEAMTYLHDKGLIKYLPRKENLHAVSHPDYAGVAENPSATKTVVMTKILDQMNSYPLSEQMVPVLSSDGGVKKPLHLWGFSDDDYANYQKAIEVLSPLVKSGRWPNVKITLYYTGKMHHEPGGGITPRAAVVIKSDGAIRPQLSEEAREVSLIHHAR